MYGPKWPIILMYGSHDMRHRFSAGLRVVNGHPGIGPSQVIFPIYYQLDLSIVTTQVSQVDEVSPSWMDPIVQYIYTGKLPYDKNKAHKVQIWLARFSLINGQLFKRSLDGPYLRCLTTEQGQYVLAKLHEGICGNHLGGRTLAHRALT